MSPPHSHLILFQIQIQLDFEAISTCLLANILQATSHYNISGSSPSSPPFHERLHRSVWEFLMKSVRLNVFIIYKMNVYFCVFSIGLHVIIATCSKLAIQFKVVHYDGNKGCNGNAEDASLFFCVAQSNALHAEQTQQRKIHEIKNGFAELTIPIVRNHFEIKAS